MGEDESSLKDGKAKKLRFFSTSSYFSVALIDTFPSNDLSFMLDLCLYSSVKWCWNVIFKYFLSMISFLYLLSRYFMIY